MPSLLELEEECNRMMMLKFGRMVDFEAVQERSVNINLEELEVEIMQKEYEHSQELKEWEKLMMLTKENTRKLQQLNRFCLEKQQLETTLDSLNDDLGAEFQGPRSTDIKEKARMESLLKHRAHDIAILREEINLLRRKDGCVREQFSLVPLTPKWKGFVAT
uniref:Uncharacterized protein n=1 Tax=Anas platyrhynchos platyrhynchos TaxID=8840 RepID=A0A493TPT2_ANAPP